MVSATAQSNDDSAELVVTAPPSFALKTKPTKVTVREMLMGARKSILITGYSLSDYFAELVDCVIQKSQEGVLVKFFVNDIESQKAFDRLCCYKGKFLRIYNYPKQEDKMSALHAKVISVDQTDIYSVSRIDRSKNIIARLTGDTYDEIDSDIVQIDSRADIIIFSSSVVTAKMDLMQRFFGFEQYIRAGAQKTIEIIRNLNIVDSLEKFVAFENKSKLTNAKKLLKAKNSPVLQMKKNDLLENLKKHSRYKTMFKFEEDHIVISSQKEAAAFIKMLNDDIVRSELTGKEYDSSSKMLLGPVGASQ